MKQASIAIVVICAAVTIGGQTVPGAPQGRGRGGPPPVRPEPLAAGDHAGFTSMFDGSSLKGWDGDPAFWRAADGELIGESSSENPVKQNTFLIWRGGAPKDFELKLEYRPVRRTAGFRFAAFSCRPVPTWASG